MVDEVSSALSRLRVVSGTASSETFDIVPNLGVIPVYIEPNCTTVDVYLSNVQQNVRAEYAAFAKNTTPKVFMALYDNDDIGSLPDTIQILQLRAWHSTEFLKPKAMDSFNFHLVVIRSQIYFTQTRSANSKDNPVFLELTPQGPWEVPNKSFQNLFSECRSEEQDPECLALFDFGYVGEFMAEWHACTILRKCPIREDSLLAAVSRPRDRHTSCGYNEGMPPIAELKQCPVPINPTQYDAIHRLKHQLEGIQGPPGTGKSTTIFHIITSRLPSDHVALATCVQNKAIDAISEKFAHNIPFIVFGNDDRLGLISKYWTLHAQVARDRRVVQIDRIEKQLKAGLLNVREVREKTMEVASGLYCDRRARQRTLRANEKFPRGTKDWQERRDEFLAHDNWKRLWESYQRQRHETIFALEKKVFNLTNQFSAEYHRVYEEVSHELKERARVILCTVGSTGSLMHSEYLAPVTERITTAILDEAGNSHESKIPVLLLLPKLDKIIAIGDQCQLQPFTHMEAPNARVCFSYQKHGHCRFGKDCKFSHAIATRLPDGFFQRIQAALPPNTVKMLTHQYRMHPEISSVVSDCFYESQLQTPDSIAISRRSASTSGLWWLDCADEEHTASNSTSAFNEGQVHSVFNVYRKLRRELPATKKILVATFYKAQYFKIMDYFKDRGEEESPTLRIATVDQSQGSEADIVILSTVRSNFKQAVGFLKNPNRINVAISRAREQLIIIGNRRTVGGDRSSKWHHIIDSCNEYDL
eukprot:m.437112 g.437112  ORF g.437112 m.437112 type:complete len:758 (-) comp21431_c0_seq1:838-3111(-)